MPVIFHCMITQALNVNLTTELRRYVKEQVRSGRYQNENEVVRDAIRQMQQREIEQFERIFGDYPGSPAWLRLKAKWVEPAPLGKRRSRDAKDDPFLACALSAKAGFVVTRGDDLLALGKGLCKN